MVWCFQTEQIKMEGRTVMFQVIIGMKRVDEKDNLAEACQVFIQKTKEMIANGGVSEYVLFEACTINAEIDGVRGVMNFDAIVDFAHATGILDEKGRLRNKPAPFIHKDFAKQVFQANSKDSLEAFLAEQRETLARIAACGAVEPEPQEPLIILVG